MKEAIAEYDLIVSGAGFEPGEREALKCQWFDRWAAEVLNAIRAAITAEREACAVQLESAARTWLDNELVSSVFRFHAEAIRARKSCTGI